MSPFPFHHPTPPQEWPLQYSYSWDKNLPWHGPRKLPASSLKVKTRYPVARPRGYEAHHRPLTWPYLRALLLEGYLKWLNVRSGQMTKKTPDENLIHNLSFFLNAWDMHEICNDICMRYNDICMRYDKNNCIRKRAANPQRTSLSSKYIPQPKKRRLFFGASQLVVLLEVRIKD